MGKRKSYLSIVETNENHEVDTVRLIVAPSWKRAETGAKKIFKKLIRGRSFDDGDGNNPEDLEILFSEAF